MENGTGIVPTMPIGGGFGGGDSWVFLFAILALMWGGNGFGAGGNSNAIQADVNRGFDNQNLQAQTRDILSAVTSGTAQSVAATNQTFHDTLAAFNDKYGELQRDIAGLSVGQANLLAKQNECCCSILRGIDNAVFTSSQNTQKVLDALAANEIQNLRDKVSALELQNNLSGVVKYPSSMTYSYAANPFCPCTGLGNI